MRRRQHILNTALVCFALAPAAARAECRSDTSTARGGSGFWSKIAALNVDPAHGRGPFESKSAAIGGIALAVGFCRWPSYTLVYRDIAYWPGHFTPYVAQEDSGLHPELYMNGAGVEVQRRWFGDRRVHPLASVGAGWINAGYEYWMPNGTIYSRHVVEGRSGARYVNAAIGAELIVFRWVRVYYAMGLQRTGEIHTPQLRPSTFNGPYNLLYVGLGKFR